MKSSRCMLLLASLIASTLIAQEAQVTPLMSKDLRDFPGKEGLMITVVYPPGLRIRFIGTTRMHLFMCWKAPL